MVININNNNEQGRTNNNIYAFEKRNITNNGKEQYEAQIEANNKKEMELLYDVPKINKEKNMVVLSKKRSK